MPADDPLLAIRALSADVGADIRLVQGAGGNLSIKLGNDLWVKASGLWLRDALTRDIFVRLDRADALARLAAGRDDFATLPGSPAGLRPSIEASFHAAIEAPVVVHVHSVSTISWAVRRDGRDAVVERLTGLPWVWVDYVRPGLPLTRLIQAAIVDRPDATVFVLANHGLIVTGSTPADAHVLLADVERRLAPPTRRPASSLGGSLPAIPPEHKSRHAAHRAVHALASSAIREGIVTGALYPDHAVFLGVAIPVRQADDVAGIVDALEVAPHCVIVDGAGVLLGARCSLNAEAMLECLALVAPTLPATNELRYLTDAQVAELTNWDAEKLRQGLAQGAAPLAPPSV